MPTEIRSIISKAGLSKTMCVAKIKSAPSVGVVATQQQSMAAGALCGNMDSFEQRKAMKPAYVELFAALFKIPDKKLQQRVMDAINGVVPKATAFLNAPCTNCKRPVTKDVATQTDTDCISKNNTSKYNFSANNTNCNRGEDMDAEFSFINAVERRMDSKRKRKRKVGLPRVVMQSHAQLHQQNVSILSKQESDTIKENITKALRNDVNEKLTQTVEHQSCGGLVSAWFDFDRSSSKLEDLHQYVDNSSRLDRDKMPRRLFSIMEKEYIDSNYSDPEDVLGYLPIHNALYDNDLIRLRRQIYVWRKLRNINLNAVLTITNKDCMEVAFGHNSSTASIEILLNAGFDLNVWYEDVGNILHLAINNEVSVETVKLLTRKVDLCSLECRNDDGYTPLFLAIRRNNYLFFEAIMDIIDERLNLRSCCNRTAMESDTENVRLKEFTQFYLHQCESLKSFNLAVTQNEVFTKKQQILNNVDPKSGSTMLLFAIEQHFDHFIYLLLANLADPSVSNYNGQDARLYYNEYCKSVNSDTNIDKYLDIVNKILHSNR